MTQEKPNFTQAGLDEIDRRVRLDPGVMLEEQVSIHLRRRMGISPGRERHTSGASARFLTDLEYEGRTDGADYEERE